MHKHRVRAGNWRARKPEQRQLQLAAALHSRTRQTKPDDNFVAGFRVQTFDTPAGSLAAQQAYPVEFESDLALTGFRLARSAVQRGEIPPNFVAKSEQIPNIAAASDYA